ncbi:LTA synthase family protein [Mesorhizobium sp. M00.F.Ca.ET.186.01.1.1]|nr:LTA synthase family protein [bacterium M00.F.Ca.ET.205.01.1.1]TGU54805.1 LTA synthase family protein [bacterium M00.F.Ca.ET.152.01.1.1]TGV38421.1 LTA synthase family protein [Mesorhizobium sp. M00.F.Ca.ET.186.01.1.1]TGZ44377.1 LTA synthase family protein [bacterium M00.F.Ca.ET.162.01.1.1]TIW61070.1 MAG: LTA synthase family protein [Mesorhizobium sp.]
MLDLISNRYWLFRSLMSAATVGSLTWLMSLIYFQEKRLLIALGPGILLALLLLDHFRETKTDQSKGRWFRAYLSLVPCFFFLVYVYLESVFGYFDWAAMSMHVGGGILTPDVVLEYLKNTGSTILVILVVLFGLGALKAHGTLTRGLDVASMALLLAANPMLTRPIAAVLHANPRHDFLSKQFVDITPLTRPEARTVSTAAAPKNLIHVFIESAERTYMDEAEFGDVMDPLLEFDRHGLSATNMVQLAYTNNSIAGMVAANCGTPLLISYFTTRQYLENNSQFLPGLTCLGDVLKARGYQQNFISGWPLGFTGQGAFYSSHGYSSLFGGPEVVAAVGGPGSSFGADDAQVLDMSFDVLRRAQRDAKPFSLTIAVSGGHAMDGYLTDKCIGKTGLSPKTPNILHAVKCTNMLIADFVHRAQAEGLMKNTILVLQSDHLSAPSTVTDRLNKYERRNFFSLSGEGVAAKVYSGLSGTIDIFPTILDALDVPLADDQAAFGISLLGDRPTLSQVFGQTQFDEAIYAEDVLVRSFWQLKPASTALAPGAERP